MQWRNDTTLRLRGQRLRAIGKSNKPLFAAWPAALRQPAPPATLAATANLKLTFHLDHSAGANQPSFATGHPAELDFFELHAQVRRQFGISLVEIFHRRPDRMSCH